MNRYSYIRFILFFIFSLLLVACGAGAPQAPAASDSAAEETTAQEEPAQEANKTEETAPETASDEATTSGGQTFQIVPEQSEVRFIIDEVLRGSPKTVVGSNSQLSGQITVDPANPAEASIGPIEIDARGFKTDQNRRNGAIQRFILQTGQPENQFITFTPTAIDGLPASAAVGDTFDFQITGDLTVHGVTQAATFAMQVTAGSETELSGSGSTTVNYADFGLTIPDVPFVASVADEVILEIEFVAAAQ